jgi:hypothetical protein
VQQDLQANMLQYSIHIHGIQGMAITLAFALDRQQAHDALQCSASHDTEFGL